MSADNGIYILRTVRTRKEARGAWIPSPRHFAYRVAYASAIDNFDWYKAADGGANLGAYLVDVWGGSRVYLDHGEAYQAAGVILEALRRQGTSVEYGVSTIEADIVFYKDM